jgi:dTDP-4-amino-4,6-dideoxygalactose transaminase
MLTTAREDWASFARVASLHGMSRNGWQRSAQGTPHYDVVMPGYKYNMMDLQAAIGLHQLASLEQRLWRRQAIWHRYDEAFADLPLTRPAPVAPGDRHARHLYTVLVDPASGWQRDALVEALRCEGISTSVHFKALHLQPYYAERFRLRPGMFPVAESVAARTLSLPLSSAMTDGQVERVVSALRALLSAR